MSNREEAFKGICNVQKGLEPANQWKRAINAMKKMNNLELAQTWIDLSNVSLAMNEHEASIILSQHKKLFKLAMKQIADENKTPCECDSDISSELLEMIKFYHDELERLSNVVAIEVQMVQDPGRYAVLHQSTGTAPETASNIQQLTESLRTAIGEIHREIAALRAGKEAGGLPLREDSHTTEILDGMAKNSDAIQALQNFIENALQESSKSEQHMLEELSNNREFFAMHMPELKTNISMCTQLSVEFQDLSANFQELLTDFGQLGNHFSDVYEKTNGYNSNIAKLSSLQDDQAQRLTILEKALNTEVSTIETLEAAQQKVLETLQSVKDSSLETLEKAEKSAVKSLETASTSALDALRSAAAAQESAMAGGKAEFKRIVDESVNKERAALEAIDAKQISVLEALDMKEKAISEEIDSKEQATLEALEASRQTLNTHTPNTEAELRSQISKAVEQQLDLVFSPKIEEIRTYTTQIQHAKTEIETINSKIKELQAEEKANVSQSETKMNALSNKIDSLPIESNFGERIQAVEGIIASAGGKTDKLAADVADISGKIEPLAESCKTTLHDIRSEMKEMRAIKVRESVENAERNIKLLTEKTSNLDSRIHSGLQGLTARIEKLEKPIGSQSAQTGEGGGSGTSQAGKGARKPASVVRSAYAILPSGRSKHLILLHQPSGPFSSRLRPASP